MDNKEIIEYSKKVISSQIKNIASLPDLIDPTFVEVSKKMASCEHKIIFIGLGKTGYISKKCASTLSSMGISSFFLHASECLHGDTGSISKKDLVLIVSNSGNSNEIIEVLPSLKKIGCYLVGICGNKASKLYTLCDSFLWFGKSKESSPYALAPIESNTSAMVFCDALILASIKIKNQFTKEMFALYHPQGNLGKRLKKVNDCMRKLEDVAICTHNETVKNVLIKVTNKKVGGCIIIENNKVTGFFSDGDLRRNINKKKLLELEINKVMSKDPICIDENAYLRDTLEIFEDKRVGEIPILNQKKECVGLLVLKDVV